MARSCTVMGKDHQDWYFWPRCAPGTSSYSNPVPKKSPIGTSTLGSVSPSQYIRSTSSRKWKGLGESIVNQICRTEPAPCISASVTVDLDFTSTQSALPPERSALDARLETASLRLATPSRGPFCCPRTKAERQPSTATTRIMRLLLQSCGRNLITTPECYAPGCGGKRESRERPTPEVRKFLVRRSNPPMF